MAKQIDFFALVHVVSSSIRPPQRAEMNLLLPFLRDKMS
jgi:hypothetical protein